MHRAPLLRTAAPAAVTLLLATLLLPPDAHAQGHAKLDAWQQRQTLDAASPYRELAWRAVGPRFCGGRIESVAVPPQQPFTLYVAPGSGNLWKSVDGGLRFDPIFEHEATFAVSAVSVAPSDPLALWVGTGEVHLGGVSWDGCGVYRSRDGGETWQHAGLAELDRIAAVVIHPSDTEQVWVSALQPSGGERPLGGVWHTADGGKSWQRQLELDRGVGAVDLVAAPAPGDAAPRLFASSWQRSGGGDGSGVHRSDDGGKSWQRLAGGLPQGRFLQRSAVGLCAGRPEIVYALFVDDRKPGDGRYGVGGVVWRSDDGGDSWRRCHADYLPTYVGWDFCDVRVDPQNPDRVYVCGQKLIRSSDGGETWSEVPERVRRLLPYIAPGMRIGEVLHLDAHELWIDPQRPDRLLLGNDGGLFESLDGGDSWLHRNTLPIAEFYTAFADDQQPYRIWGGTQDNASLFGPAAAIDETQGDPWRHVFLDIWSGGDGFVTVPDPTDPNVAYFEHQNGELRRKQLDGSILTHRADQLIRPRGKGLQFAWNTPVLISAHDPRRLYFGSQHLHVSADRGDSWTILGDDLGAGRALDTLSESPRIDGLLYAGTRGRRCHARDPEGDGSWRELGALPRGSLQRLVASRHVDDRVYACIARPGPAAGVLRSDDRGATWTAIDDGLPPETVRVLVEDPRDRRILYVGTDRGVCVSTDAGASWQSLSSTLPTTPVFDLTCQAREQELIAATHGRGIWVLDVQSIRSRPD